MRRGYAGCYTMTPDGKMIVDRAPGIEGRGQQERGSAARDSSSLRLLASHSPNWRCNKKPPQLTWQPFVPSGLHKAVCCEPRWNICIVPMIPSLPLSGYNSRPIRALTTNARCHQHVNCPGLI